MSAIVDSSVAFDGFEESMMKRPMYTDQHHSEFAFHRFSLLREKNILTDAVILSSDDKRFNVHSNIMAGKSDYFFNNLLDDVEHDEFSDYTALENSCQLNIDSETVDVIITFCYTGAAELTIDNVESVLIGAKELQIDSLALLCNEMLEELLDMTNCIRFLEIANKHEIEMLKENALAIISEELPHINRLPEFYHLNGSQMFWLIELLSNSEDGIFDDLLKSLNDAENVFPSHLLAGTDTHAAIRAAFIAGYFQGSICNIPQLHESCRQRAQSTAILTELNSQIEIGPELTIEGKPSQTVHVLALLKRKTIQFSTFCEIEQKWENPSKKIDLMQTIETFRDAVMIVIHTNIMMFNMRNGVIAHAHHLALDTGAVETIRLPNDVECAKLALFCLLNDEIYCFARADQQFFHKFDLKSKLWSTGHVEDDVLDAKCIVGLNDELYFVGCGYNRIMVRSYHIKQKQWTTRGNLRNENNENQETCFKAVELNGAIFVVMSGFDQQKIYNGTEFVVQRYDENVEDWFIIKKLNYSHFVNYFHVDVAGGCLYLFYGDGEVQIYNEEQNEWHKGPSIDYNVLDVSMCMVTTKQDSQWIHK
ncbi:uncharacterized protein LOC129565580 [Sitodiplosis mosellana]|uniref:uncharacterized protein LOC129565580 n=1 Tax=Sitodiplosis mosellana TaxID=263140 RepID=UPI002444936E|nr:uncharacterized protein LOC129565580 [Sitodiplosis mosellana]